MSESAADALAAISPSVADESAGKHRGRRPILFRSESQLGQLGQVLKKALSRLSTRLRRRWLLVRKRIVQRRRRSEMPSRANETVFVCGMMRSGTNMVMEILEQCFDTDVFHESDPRAFNNYVMRDKSVIHGLIDSSDARCVVVKALLESHKLMDLLDEFSPARAIWVYRNLDDSVNSQLSNFSSTPESVHRMATDPDFSDWRTEGLNDKLRSILRQHCHDGTSRASSAALFWLVRNLSFFEQGLDRRPDVYLLRYEDCVLEPDTLRAMFDWLRLAYRPQFGSRIFASSISKREAPDIDPEIRRLCDDVTARFDSLRQAQGRGERCADAL